MNTSLQRRVLHRLDARARRAGETRSGFIARMAVEAHHAPPMPEHIRLLPTEPLPDHQLPE